MSWGGVCAAVLAAVGLALAFFALGLGTTPTTDLTDNAWGLTAGVVGGIAMLAATAVLIISTRTK